MNELIFLLHIMIIAISSLVALWLGKEALIAYVCVLGILSNLFVTKQILLFGLNVTATDAFVVGAVLGLQLLQEYYGKKIARKAIGASFFLLIFYAVVSWIHMRYLPSFSDVCHGHFMAILKHMPRIAVASITSYLLSQLLDYNIYGFLKKIFKGRHLVVRSYISLAIVQLFDTVLFSFLGLYGIITNVGNVIVLSFAIKMIVILIATPLVAFSPKIIKKSE